MSSHPQPRDQGAVTVSTLSRMKRDGERFTSLTAYDASFARLLDEQGVEVLLVGDSLGMVVQGHGTTVPVTVDDMIYHSRMVARGCRRALLMVDMPFMSYATVEQGLTNARRLMQEGHAQMVKIEGGREHLAVVRALSTNGVPVCVHLGLLPQSVHKLGGYRVQAKESHAADALLEDALAMQEAGADIVLVECIPASLSERLVAALDVPLIGIGAGPACDGQVLVVYDMLGITSGHKPRFVANFMDGRGSIDAAVAAYVEAVKTGVFPGAEHSF